MKNKDILLAQKERPKSKPSCPNFSCGPCTKHPDWSLDNLKYAALGRSHRSKLCKEKLAQAITQTKDILRVPDDYLVGIMPGSDTGAFEAALWSLLGARGVDVLGWESFSNDWVYDIREELRLPDQRVFQADYGKLPDLSAVDFARDVVFAWNGTTSGVCVPHGDWIPDKTQREGLVLVDATSIVFAIDFDWDKIDVLTFSWQKVMGGEAAHGILILSPRAVERLLTYVPEWPIPKLFRLVEKGKLNEGIFKGVTINTPSLLAVEDYLDVLGWARRQNGLDGLLARSAKNNQVLNEWVEATDWVDFLCQEKENRSPTSICLVIKDERITSLPQDRQARFVKNIISLLEKENVAYDIASYRTAPLGLRIWAGATVEANDLEILTQWLNWAFAECLREI